MNINSMNTNKRWNLKYLVAATVIALAVFLFFNHFLNQQKHKLKADETLKSSVYGNLLWTEVDRELNAILFISNGMASYISAYRDDLVQTRLNLYLKTCGNAQGMSVI